MTDLTVAEVFGPTVQGEGPSMGQRAGFVRLGLCNLDCGAGPGAKWACDTPYTWDWTGKLGTAYDKGAELSTSTVDEVVDRIDGMGVDLVVISGGEPLLQHRRLGPLLDWLLDDFYQVEIETNGTIDPAPHHRPGTLYNVSPKLTSSGVDRDRAIDFDVLRSLASLGARFKFVVASPTETDEVASIVTEADIDPGRVWLMPAGTTVEAVTGEPFRVLTETAVRLGWNATSRLHVAAWGSKRGV